MRKKLLPALIALTLLLSNCRPPGTSLQVDLFRLVPEGALAVSYMDIKTIRQDPELSSILERTLAAQQMPAPYQVDAMMGVVWSPPKDASTLSIPFVTIQRVSREGKATAEPPQSSDLTGEVPEYTHEEYLGVKLTMTETEQGYRLASASIDETTSVFGEETGVKAILDLAKGRTESPFADLGAALPPVFAAILRGECEGDAQGCTAKVDVALAKKSQSTLTVYQLYQFESAERAAEALPAIEKEQQEGGKTQAGSVAIVGDTITQEGRFVKVEGTLPIEDLSRIFQ